MARPRIYDDAEELQQECDRYFLQCETKKERPTITGLTLALGFCDKSTVYDYRDRPEFSHPIKRALTIIENGLEKRLDGNNVTGIIFGLKNMGWADKTEVDSNIKASVQVNFKKAKRVDD